MGFSKYRKLRYFKWWIMSDENWVRSEVNFVPYQLVRLKYIIPVTKPVQVTPPFRTAFYAGLFWVILAISVIPAKTLFSVWNHFCLRKLVVPWDWDNDEVSAEPTATSWPYSVNLHLSFLLFFLSSPLLRLTPAFSSLSVWLLNAFSKHVAVFILFENNVSW